MTSSSNHFLWKRNKRSVVTVAVAVAVVVVVTVVVAVRSFSL